MTEATLVYDDDCGFCTWWARRVSERADVDLAGFSDLTDDQTDRLPADWEDCAHLLTADAVYSCGAAAEEAMLLTDLGAPARDAVSFLRGFEEYHDLREWAYRLGADNRDTLGSIVSERPPAREQSTED